MGNGDQRGAGGRNESRQEAALGVMDMFTILMVSQMLKLIKSHTLNICSSFELYINKAVSKTVNIIEPLH